MHRENELGKDQFGPTYSMGKRRKSWTVVITCTIKKPEGIELAPSTCGIPHIWFIFKYSIYKNCEITVWAGAAGRGGAGGQFWV